MASWRSEPELRSQLEGAAFELLGQLCSASARGRKAVGSSEACGDCVARAIEIVGLITGHTSIAPPPLYDEVDDNSEEDNEEAAAKPQNADPVPSDDSGGGDADLCASALSFLSSLVPLPSVCKEITENDNLIKGSSSLVGNAVNQTLQYEAVKFMKALAPHAKKEHVLNSELIAGVLETVLKVKSTTSSESTSTINANLLFSTTVSGIQIVFNSIPAETQLAVAGALADRFCRMVKNTTTAKGDQAHGGQLAYNLTTMLLLARGKDSAETIFTGQLVTSLIHLIQWRYDPKTRLEAADASLWNASVTICLQILSMTLMTTEERLVQLGVKRSDLANTVLMVARPGKAPRKAIDLSSALSKAIDGNDAASSVAAQSLKSQLLS